MQIYMYPICIDYGVQPAACSLSIPRYVPCTPTRMREIFAEALDSLMMIAIGARPRGKINVGYVSGDEMGEIEGGCAPTITNGPARCIANHNHVLKIETG
jgi:hypothetical protein